MHRGGLPSLQDVMEHYNEGVSLGRQNLRM